MSRIVMTLFSIPKNNDDHTIPIENCKLGVASCEDALVGVYGRDGTFHYSGHVKLQAMLQAQEVREAQITLNLCAKTGRRHEAEADAPRVFF